MAIHGIGGEYDATFLIDDNLKTSTSQYRIVGAMENTSTADRTVGFSGVSTSVATPTGSAYGAIGVCQSKCSAGSIDATIRLWGISKVYCAASVCAFDFVRAYSGANTTTAIGGVVPVTNGASVSAATMSIASHVVVLGRALEDGSTGTVISVFLNPQMWDASLIA